MRTLAILLRTNFLSLVGSYRKKSKTSIVITAIAMLLLVLFLVGSFAFIGGSSTLLLVKKDLGEYSIFLSIIISMVIALMFGVVNSTRDARGNDTDMLLSMPIPKSSIVLSKLLGMYLLDVVCSLVMLLPTYIILYVKDGQPGAMVARGILIAMLLPAIPLFVSLVVGAGIAYLKRTTKFGQMISSVVFILVWLLYMFSVTRMNSMAEDINLTPAESVTRMKKFGPLYWFTEAIYRGNLKYFIFTLLLTLIPLAIAVVIHSRGLNAVNYHADHSKKARKYEANSVRVATLKMEFRRYLSSTNYVMNTILGTLLLLVMAILVVVKGQGIINSVGASEIDVNGETKTFAEYMTGPMIATILAALMNFFAVMTITTTPSVSIEGKRLWISKTLPVETKFLLDAKIIVSLLIYQPISILSCIVMSIALRLGVMSCIMMILVTSVFQLLTSLIGLIFGLIYVRLDWTNDAQVVKSGIGIFFTLIVNFVLAIIALIVLIFTALTGHAWITYALCGAFFVVNAGLCVGAYAIITHYGVRKYESLNG